MTHYVRVCSHLRRRAAAVVAIVVALASGVAAESPSAPALKAAFLYNFAKFADWPDDALAPGQKLALCVVGENAVADALEQIIRGHVVEGHELTVQVLKAGAPMRGCHLLYVSGLGDQQAVILLDTLKGAAVLTVGDGGKFAELGGVAQLVLEDDRMRFIVNLTAVTRARLSLSAKLLSLAKIIKDDRDVQR